MRRKAPRASGVSKVGRQVTLFRSISHSVNGSPII